MFSYISFLTRRPRTRKSAHRRPDPSVSFTSKDWADLPAHHPRRPDHE